MEGSIDKGGGTVSESALNESLKLGLSPVHIRKYFL